MTLQLDLGWCQGYMALQYHMEDALREKGLNPGSATPRPPIAIFSQKYYNELQSFDHTRKHDFCFIGSINSNAPARQWVIEFAKKHFTKDSVFVNTDNNPNWEKLGEFDLSDKNLGHCPKAACGPERVTQYRIPSENLFYFQTMCQSKYVLCPAGDAPWSFRFYEILMCHSIPMVETWHHTYRTAEEAEFKYQYVLNSDVEKLDSMPYDDMLEKNIQLFRQHHLLH